MSYESQIGTYHLGENPQLYSPQRANNYEFVVTNIDDILRPGAIGTEKNGRFRNAQEILRVSISKAFVPHFTQSVVEVKRGNSTIKFAGTPTFDSGTIEFHDFIGADTKEILMAWQHLSYNVYTEKVGSLDVPEQYYKKDAYLLELTPDNRKHRQWILRGCWISGISEGDYSNYDSDKKMLSCVINYDSAMLDQSEVLNEGNGPRTSLGTGPLYRV